MTMNPYLNYTPTLLKPIYHDLGLVTLRFVDGVGREERANPNSVITSTLMVRIKDVPRILGEENTMLMNISEVSGASISIFVDMRSLLNHHVHVTLWGIAAHVVAAERLIGNLIKEGYDEPYEPLSHHYLRHQVMTFPMDKAVFLPKENNIVKIEGDTLTWIEVDASKAWKNGETREVDIHVYGSKNNVNNAVNIIRTIVSQVPTGIVKKSDSLKKVRNVLRRSRTGLLKGTKVSSKFIWNGLKSCCKKMKKKNH